METATNPAPGEQLYADTAQQDFTPRIGDRVAVTRVAHVDPNRGTRYAWEIGPASTANNSRQPGWAYPSGGSEQRTGWGVGVVVGGPYERDPNDLRPAYVIEFTGQAAQ